ncbi:MAG: hypothetical protein E6J26_03345 [Chloroflexi bacterium]|nr:MAG: hypothetical protein E6J26_03345 [Chloroflexota bacterium]
MSFITSRSYEIDYKPSDDEYHMWRRKLWPYVEVDRNQLLYFYETPTQCLVWKTRITEVERFEYNSKSEARRGLKNFFGYDHEFDSPYFRNAPKQGYCLAYKVEVLGKRLNLEKRPAFRMPRLGWDWIDEKRLRKWFRTYRP